MKKLIIVGLLAVSPMLAFASPVKTSKPVALSETQMQSVKGQGTIVVFVWSNNTWVLSAQINTGPNGPSGVYYIGGP